MTQTTWMVILALNQLLHTILATYASMTPSASSRIWLKGVKRCAQSFLPETHCRAMGPHKKKRQTDVYLSSLQSSDGYCRTYLNHHMGFDYSTATSLGCIWKDKCLPKATKIRFYQALLLSMLMSDKIVKIYY